MRYLQAVIESEDGQQLFKKDFQVQKIFSVVTALWVRSLIDTGLLRETDNYNAFIVPRYGPFERLSYPESPPRYTHENAGKIILEYQEPCQPDTPVAFFSVGILVPYLPQPYWANFLTISFAYFWHNLEEAILQARIAAPGTRFRHKLYARDDEQADFEQEERALAPYQPGVDPLIEIIPIDDAPGV